MSLQPLSDMTIPSETARIAHAVFPNGNTYMRMRDQLGTIYSDEQFADLFPTRGQPALSPARLALVTVMQFAEGLSDRAAADAVRARIDWKYALGLSIEDSGFDASVLSEFRQRLLGEGAERQLLNTMLECFQQAGLLKTRGCLRTDSTHVLAAVRVLNRLECVGETVRQALNAVATLAPDWLQSWVPPEWFDRYSRRFEEFRLPQSREGRHALGEQIGCDGFELWHRLDDRPTTALLRELPALETLRQVWIQQYEWQDGAVRWRQQGDLPPASLLISSPYDLEARYAKKRNTAWVGYKVHLTETCDDELPHLIVNVETTAAPESDFDMTPQLHERLAEQNLLPSQHLVDAGYTSAEHLAGSQEMGIDLLGPVAGDRSWQAQAGEGFDRSGFTIDWELQRAYCPQGQMSNRWTTYIQQKHAVYTFRFPEAACRQCEVRSKCTRSASPRALIIQPQQAYEALQAARERQHREAFKEEYNRRAGVEGTISQGVAVTGLRRARYVGLEKSRLQHVLTALGLNILRLSAWWAEVKPAQTRMSSFARLAPSPIV